MKDIFIDNVVAIRFAKNPNKYYEDLMNWLQDNNCSSCLLVSPMIVKEYFRSCTNYTEGTAIAAIYDKLQKSKNKLNRKEKPAIEGFKAKYFTKTIWKNLRSKRRDSDDPSHIALILLSERKMALIDDNNFIYDLINFPKFGKNVIVERSPELLNYK